MAESTIITGQFVRISQTPASIGERLLALVIDYFLIVIYVYSTATLLTELRLPSGFTLIFFLCVIYLPILGYSFLCETFNHGQSFGKRIMNIRVVKADGTTPSISSYLLRWLLFPIDGPITGGLGILVVLLTKNSQRMGDLAAGTMVIKEKNYRKIHVSLDEFDYLTKDYHPVYPQSADLSLEQVNVITRTLQSSEKDRPRRILLLAQKVQELLSITPRDNNQEKFLQTVLRDYQYYTLGLFGSVARGEQNEKSDIDVFIKLRKTSYYTLMDIKDDLEQVFRQKVDLITLHETMRALFRRKIEQDAIYL